ncbi:bacteriohemerythrin [Maridesulfovibrio bastinii]|uniref:bacteriohemerythrin n=1 Tax=Maridesulfovibrio bastinii TaxID=47157 RepID=UPI000407925A|nr:bacteriohemerythrin [Maridesulfovibrio bastinii]
MTEFEIDDDLYADLEELDKQHANLFRIFNMLKCTIEDKDDDSLFVIIEELKNYMRYHFSAEEKMLEKFSYEALQQHRKEHEAFTDKMGDFNFDLVTGDPDLGKNMLDYLKNWLQNHINKSDRKAFKSISIPHN